MELTPELRLELYDLIKSGKIIVNNKSPLEYRFWLRVDKNGPIHPTLGKCWKWVGKTRIHNYGKLCDNLAHRLSYEFHIGPIPEGQCVLRKCDNGECTNPEHLFLGTHQDNMRDMRDKDRHARGERQGRSILTEEDVVYIRQRYRRYSHEDGCGAIARDLRVSLIAVFKVVKKMSWRHVE